MFLRFNLSNFQFAYCWFFDSWFSLYQILKRVCLPGPCLYRLPGRPAGLECRPHCESELGILPLSGEQALAHQPHAGSSSKTQCSARATVRDSVAAGALRAGFRHSALSGEADPLGSLFGSNSDKLLDYTSTGQVSKTGQHS